jgi:toluene monooxygenase system ferredoxin subunit
MTDDVRWFDAVEVAELWEGDLLDVEVGGEEVLLVHLDGGQIRAYQGMCPHQEISLADGKWDVDTSALVCSGHSWEFDLRTGEGINPQGCQLFSFPVQVVEDTVRVGVPQDGQRHYNRFAGS